MSRNLSQSVVAVVMEEVAHYLDLRASNPADPPSVTAARELEKKCIIEWISQPSSRQPPPHPEPLYRPGVRGGETAVLV